jgi:hypothetical protein
MVEQGLLVLRQAEEPAFLDRPLDWRALGRQLGAVLRRGQLVFFVIGLIANRVPPFVAIEVKVPLFLHSRPDRLARAIMRLVRRANEKIVRNVKGIAHLLEKTRHFVCELTSLYALRPCGLSHLQPVLVGAGLEADVPALRALKAGNDVGRDRFISVADVRRTVGIADRGGDVERIGHCARPSGAVLALQGRAFRDVGKKAAKLEYCGCRIQGQPRRSGRQLSGARIGIERAQPWWPGELPCFTRDQRRQ